MSKRDAIADAMRRALHHPGKVRYAWDDERPTKDEYGGVLPSREETQSNWRAEADRLVGALAEKGLTIEVAP